MSLIRFIRRFKQRHMPTHSDPTNQMLDDLLTTSAQRLRTADPQTKMQWQTLVQTLSRNEVSDLAESQTISQSFRRPIVGIAVAIAIVSVFTVIWVFRPSVRMYETAKGEQMTVVLEDSSEVILNHTTQLTVTRAPLGKARLVSLKGEAYFHVRHNGLPFVVSTDLGTIKVLGTEFDVRVRDRQMEVGVVRGTVEVSCRSNGIDSSLILSGDQIVACAGVGFLERPVVIPFSDYPGWVHGKLMFYRTEFTAVCRELESRYDVAIAIRDQRMSKATITGTLDNQNIESALTTLTELTGSKYRREGNTYIVY